NALTHFHIVIVDIYTRSVCLDHPLHQAYFFFKHTVTTEIYTLSLHDALPISTGSRAQRLCRDRALHARSSAGPRGDHTAGCAHTDRKSTRLNSSHVAISYAVFCLKKKIVDLTLTERAATTSPSSLSTSYRDRP